MAWFGKKENVLRTLSQLSIDEREEIEGLLIDGVPVSQVATEYGVSSQALYQVKRQQQGTGAPKTQRLNPDIELIRQEAALLKEQSNFERLKEDLDYERERRALDLEIKRIELEERRRELDGGDFDASEFAENPDTALFKFFGQILNKQQGANTQFSAPPPPPPTQKQVFPDWNIPVPIELIQLEIENYPTSHIEIAKTLSDADIELMVRKKYPSCHPENIKNLITLIRQ